MKTTLRKTCENYYNIKNPTKINSVISKLTKNNNIVVIKQDKGR